MTVEYLILHIRETSIVAQSLAQVEILREFLKAKNQRG